MCICLHLKSYDNRMQVYVDIYKYIYVDAVIYGGLDGG